MRFTRLHDDEPLSELDIQAYADGSLEHERAAHVRRYLSTRPGEIRRILFYRHLNAQIRHVFHRPDAHESADFSAAAMRSLPPRRTGSLRGGMAFIAAGLIGLVGFAAGTWAGASLVPEAVQDDAAAVAVVEADGQSFAAAVAGENPGENAGGSAGPASTAPDLRAAGMRVVARQTLHFGAFASATRYVYANADGVPVVLIDTRTPFAWRRSQWMARRVGDLRLLSWTTIGHRWVLAGHAKTRGLMTAADVATMGVRSDGRDCSGAAAAGGNGAVGRCPR